MVLLPYLVSTVEQALAVGVGGELASRLSVGELALLLIFCAVLETDMGGQRLPWSDIPDALTHQGYCT